MYCDISENCKLVKQANTQYDEVVNQNRNLQTDLRNLESELQKYRKATIMLVENIYEVYDSLFDEQLKRDIEEFLMIEKVNYALNDRRNATND